MISIPLDPFLIWLMVFLRISFLFVFFPLFGDGFVPLRIRILLSAVMALMLTPVVPFGADLFPQSQGAMIGMVASEALLGMVVAMVGRGLFAVVQFSGQLAGEQMGFGIVNTLVPSGGQQVSVVAELQYLLSVMIFLAVGIHHIVIAVIVTSFGILAPGAAVMTSDVGDFFVSFGQAIFALSLQLAMPVIVVVFAINMAMAMIGRAVPQVNVFLESFPLRIIGGLLTILASLGILVRLWIEMFGSVDSLLSRLLTFLAG